MSTRGRIGIELPDGKIKSIYCHFDSYPDGVGKVLIKYYNDIDKINALIDLGDISSLGEVYDEEVSKGNWKDKKTPLKEDITYTIAYKDRGEDTPPRIDENEQEFLGKLGNCCEEYGYLYKTNFEGKLEWFITDVPSMRPLNWAISNE